MFKRKFLNKKQQKKRKIVIFSIGKVSQIDDNFVQGGYKKHLGRNYLQQSILSLKRVKTMQLVSQSFFFFFCTKP